MWSIRTQHSPDRRIIATICEWIDSRVTGGYIYGVARLGKSRAVKFWVEARLSEKYRGALPFFRLIYLCEIAALAISKILS
jgi:hypothetical protein